MRSLGDVSAASTSYALAADSRASRSRPQRARTYQYLSPCRAAVEYGEDKHEGRIGRTTSTTSDWVEGPPETRRDMRQVVCSALLACACSLSLSGVAVAEEMQAVQPLFENKCAGCHSAGGNILAAGKTLQIEDLRKNDVATIESLYERIYFGKAKMPGFGADCTPAGQCTFAARLSNQQVTGLSEYVLQKAEEGWKE